MKRLRITKQVVTETSHRLWNHPHACKNIHGHSYMFEVTVEGDIDLVTGMVCDFKFLKTAMMDIIECWDHAIILHCKDPFLPTIKQLDTRLFVLDYMPTAENMAISIGEQMTEFFKNTNIEVIGIKVRETLTSCAEWRKGSPLC